MSHRPRGLLFLQETRGRTRVAPGCGSAGVDIAQVPAQDGCIFKTAQGRSVQVFARLHTTRRDTGADGGGQTPGVGVTPILRSVMRVT